MSTATDPRLVSSRSDVPGAIPESPESPSIVERAKERVQEAASSTVESAKHVGASVKESAEHQIENLRETAVEYYDQGKEKAVALSHEVERYVRREPAKSLAIAAGLGFVAGFLMIRR